MTPHHTLSSFDRASRAAALVKLLHDHLREGTEPVDHQVEPETVCLAVDMLHDLLGSPISWEGVRNPEEQQAVEDELAARRRAS